MNCRKENYETFIIFKANGWHEIATRAIDKHQRAWGAKNYRRLIRRHPEIFGDPESKGEGAEAPVGSHKTDARDSRPPVPAPTSISQGNGQRR